MKILTLFMAALMLTLAFVDLCNDGEKSCAAASAVQQKQDRNDEALELCSPFCNCARCSFSVLIPQKHRGGAVAETYSVYSTIRPERLPFAVAIPVWQPPKMA